MEYHARKLTPKMKQSHRVQEVSKRTKRETPSSEALNSTMRETKGLKETRNYNKVSLSFQVNEPLKLTKGKSPLLDSSAQEINWPNILLRRI